MIHAMKQMKPALSNYWSAIFLTNTYIFFISSSRDGNMTAQCSVGDTPLVFNASRKLSPIKQETKLTYNICLVGNSPGARKLLLKKHWEKNSIATRCELEKEKKIESEWIGGR